MAAKGEVLFTASAAASASRPCSTGGGSGGGGASEHAVASRREPLEDVEMEPLEDVEMDAARALADFAQMALLEREGHGGGGGGWREDEGLGRAEESEGLSRKRAKGEPAAGAVAEKGAPERGETWTDASSSRLRQQQTIEVEDHHQHKEGGECREEGKIDLGSSSAVCKPACGCSNRQGRQNLTEGEKEARRLRRVLANRESARQTILRRKALCEELAKKAVELSEENENMKMEREAALKEYLSLRDRNMQLKEQMAKIVKCGVEEHPPCTKTSQQPTEPPAPSSIVHGSPPRPEFAWSPVLKPSGAVSRHERVCQEKEVSALPSLSFQLPPQCPSCLRPIPYLLPALWSGPTGHDGGEGPSRGREHATSRMRDLTSSSTRGENCAEGESSTKTLEPVTKQTEQAADDTSKLCTTGASHTLEAHPASALLTRPFDHVVTARDAVATPAPVGTQAGLRRGRRMLSATPTTSEARRRRRELMKLKHIYP